MKIKVTIHPDIDTAKILKKRGLGASHDAAMHIAGVVRRLCDPYVPMSGAASAHMKNTAQVVDDVVGAAVVYNAPYAHYQYYGEVMAGKPKKHYTGVPLTYNQAPMRGKEWDKRMMAERGDEVVKELAKYVGGKYK